MNHHYESKTTVRIFLSWVIPAWLCLFALLALPDILPAANGSAQPTANIDPKLLEGRWVRPDGGYILELKNIKDDGSLTAAYFNPRKINVSQTFWSMNEEKIALFVELRDINYPGSKYILRYDPATDRLTGNYFQAMERQTYAVVFLRER